MDVIKLNDQLLFGIEQESKRLRLAIFEDEAEIVCRKANRTELVKFIRAESGHLFKGRLQLDNSGGYICAGKRPASRNCENQSSCRPT